MIDMGRRMCTRLNNSKLAIVRGGGDLASGVINRLWLAHFDVLALETAFPLVVRRTVSVAQAIFDGCCTVEGMRAQRIASVRDWDRSEVGVLVDPEGRSIPKLSPDLVIDAIMKKKHTGTSKEMAPLVIALGPGFSAPDQVHGVIETQRGHYLGRLITNGRAASDTGVPGTINGFSTQRLLRATVDGSVMPVHSIGDRVVAGETVAEISGIPVHAQINGVLRGLIHPSVTVTRGMKIGDIDPSGIHEHCFTISDKALAVAGGVLEAVLRFGIIDN